eukprot:CAMPEP_0202428262 /NCGR_PEP_ID=MMETSP1345-20130828/2312_1 /ASSEMBLY_ACC=CAM_ASM_000843 /TAXON_ID=342563 /ORGANISM="Fabrea Fabrea salina" /LENGTH=242 /DNA_ID=CAMNT_0049039197 /DNA_START=438 /DNA_END=1162 /DNA_ORIENTATION=-
MPKTAEKEANNLLKVSTKKITPSRLEHCLKKESTLKKALKDLKGTTTMLPRNLIPESALITLLPTVDCLNPVSKEDLKSKEKLTCGLTFTPEELKVHEDHSKLLLKSNVNPKSLRILEKLKMAKFHRIFKALNPKEGKINYETIVSGDLDCDLLKVINPLVEEIKKSKEELTFEEFCAALETLMKKLTPEEKNYLVVGSQKSPKLNLSLGSISPINKRYSKEEVTTETDFEEVLKTPEKTFR